MGTSATRDKTKLVYIIGRYPELTTTFVEREIDVLRRFEQAEVQTVSIRYPLTPSAVAPEHQSIRENTLYLVPQQLSAWSFIAIVMANLRFIFLRPLVYFGTLIYLLSHEHPNLKARLKTLPHFLLAVYAAYLLRRHEFDHLHAHFVDRAVVVAMVTGRLLDKPYSLTAHANSIFADRVLIREKVHNAKFVVTVSEYNKTYLLDTYPGLDPDRIHVLHPWVDVSQFTPPPARHTHAGLHILSVGRLVEKKGHIYLIEACYLLKQRGLDFECRVVGSGPLKQALETGIARYDLQDCVHLMGAQPQCTVVQLLESWADAFALPCVIARDGDRDGIPVALAEAMAMELPVVSSDIVGIGELVKPGSGMLVPPHDAHALAEALQTIQAGGAAVRTEMGRQGRAIVDAEFNLVRGTAQLAALFRGV